MGGPAPRRRRGGGAGQDRARWCRRSACAPPAARADLRAGHRASQDSERDSLDLFGTGDRRAAARLRFAYRDAEGSGSRRTVRPLALHFWGRSWTLAAWCELRDDFRTFRVDRAERLEVTDERFQREAGRTLEDYLARVTRAP